MWRSWIRQSRWTRIIQFYMCGEQLQYSPLGIFLIISGMYYILLGGYAHLDVSSHVCMHELVTYTFSVRAQTNYLCFMLHVPQFSYWGPVRILLQPEVLVHGNRFLSTFLSFYWFGCVIVVPIRCTGKCPQRYFRIFLNVFEFIILLYMPGATVLHRKLQHMCTHTSIHSHMYPSIVYILWSLAELRGASGSSGCAGWFR